MNKICLSVLLLLFGLIGTAYSTVPARAADREYTIKAIFLYNFFNYITWPADSMQQDQSATTLCIYGDDPFGEALSYVEKKSRPQRALHIKRLGNKALNKDTPCHILFVSQSESDRLTKLNGEINRPGMLTVSDIQGFAGSKGIIEFTKDHDRIKLTINAKRLQQAGFKASSQLMKIATVIKPEAE